MLDSTVVRDLSMRHTRVYRFTDVPGARLVIQLHSALDRYGAWLYTHRASGEIDDRNIDRSHAADILRSARRGQTDFR